MAKKNTPAEVKATVASLPAEGYPAFEHNGVGYQFTAPTAHFTTLDDGTITLIAGGIVPDNIKAKFEHEGRTVVDMGEISEELKAELVNALHKQGIGIIAVVSTEAADTANTSTTKKEEA